MTARWMALVFWAAAAASGVYWGMKLFARATPAPAHATVARAGALPRGDLTRLLGVDIAPLVAMAPPPSARFHLIGVVAPRSPGAAAQGIALIAVDDDPPKSFRVGAVVDGETVLKAVHARGASLGPRDGPGNVSLDLPPPAPAATGALPIAVAPGAPAFPRANAARPLPLPGALPNLRPGLNGAPGGMARTRPGQAQQAGNSEDREDGQTQ